MVKNKVEPHTATRPYLQKEPRLFEEIWASTLKRKCLLNYHTTKRKSVISFGLGPVNKKMARLLTYGMTMG